MVGRSKNWTADRGRSFACYLRCKPRWGVSCQREEARPEPRVTGTVRPRRQSSGGFGALRQNNRSYDREARLARLPFIRVSVRCHRTHFSQKSEKWVHLAWGFKCFGSILVV